MAAVIHNRDVDNYYPRIIDKLIEDEMHVSGAVQIKGLKWCGKSTSARRLAKTVIDFGNPDEAPGYRAIADVSPSLLLRGEKPVLIDEWQDVPKMWDAVKIAVDTSGGKPGEYLLTGSAVENRSKIVHTGTGRIAKLDMRTMSLFESMESTGSVSLMRLFEGDGIGGQVSPLSIPDLIFTICRGGFPQSLQLDRQYAVRVGRNYLNDVCNDDISRVDGVERNPEIARRILAAYSRNIATLATADSLVKDASHGEPLSSQTFYDYVSALKKLFVICDIDAWNPQIRSATAMRSSPKRMIADPAIAVAALSLSPQLLERDMPTLGFLFECIAARDLLVYSSALRGSLSYYRDRYGLEADFVLHLEDGRYALIECKLGERGIEEGIEHLVKLRSLIERNNSKADGKAGYIRPPEFLMILTGGKIASTTKDGVHIVPIGTLGP